MLSPKALSLRSMVCRLGSGSRDVSSEESEGGISERSREVKMSARLMLSRVVLVRRMEARAEQAGAPRVLPLREMWVTVRESWRGVRCGRICSAVSSLGGGVVRVKVVPSMMCVGL